MKYLWAKISYIWFIIMLFFVGLFSGNLKVFAVTDEAFSSAESRVFIDQQGTETLLDWHNIPYTQSVSYPVTQMQFRLKATNGFRKDNTYRFKVSYLPSPDALYAVGIWFSDGTSSLDASCTGFVKESNGYYANTCTISPLVDLSSSQAIYVRFVFQPGYVNSIRSWVGTFVESQGVASTIENQTIDITNSIDNSTNEIINNQNENTQAIIDSNKSCQLYDKNSIVYDNKYLNEWGNEIVPSVNYWGITDYININGAEIKSIAVSSSANASLCFYNVNKSLISCIENNSLIQNGNIIIPNNALFVRFTIRKDLNMPQFYICKNGSQAIEDTLTDDSIDDPSAFIDEMVDLLPSNGVITSLITLPITLYQKILNSINGTCSQFNLGQLYGTNLIIPCIDVADYLGSTLWSTIDIIISGLFVLTIARKMVKAFEGFTSMKEGDVIND